MRIYILLSAFLMNFGMAQNSDSKAKAEPSSFEQIKVERLERQRREIISLEDIIYNSKKDLAKKISLSDRIKIEEKIERVNLELTSKKHLFVETASSFQTFEAKDEAGQKKDIWSEVEDILRPTFTTIRRLGEKPRKIEALKSRKEELQDYLLNSNAAVTRLEELLSDTKYKSVKRRVNRSISFLKVYIKKINFELDDINYQLVKNEKESSGIFTEISKLIFTFLRTKGKNLLLAFLSFLGMYFIFDLFRKKFIGFVAQNLDRDSLSKDTTHWGLRPIRIFYDVFAWLFAFSFMVLTLYSLNDWFLVTILLLMIGAIIWSTKKYIPQFFEQIKLILNLGAVRENERVVYDDLPWKVKTLGLYCRLENPLLSGGTLRIHSKHLLNSHSRPVNATEPWYPTKLGDWVILNNDQYGRVAMQTPEQVSIKLIGGSMQYYKTCDFLKMDIINLTQNGYAVEIDLGLDYSHQSQIEHEILPQFRSFIKSYVYEKYSKNKINDFVVELAKADTSSLNIRVFIRLKGELASEKLKIERSLNRGFIEFCNTHSLIIPFNQLTVHYNGNEAH